MNRSDGWTDTDTEGETDPDVPKTEIEGSEGQASTLSRGLEKIYLSFKLSMNTAPSEDFTVTNVTSKSPKNHNTTSSEYSVDYNADNIPSKSWPVSGSEDSVDYAASKGQDATSLVTS